jgi:hypothetical protein
MPKLDGTHLPQRLAERLAELKAGKEVAARDVKALNRPPGAAYRRQGGGARRAIGRANHSV